MIVAFSNSSSVVETGHKLFKPGKSQLCSDQSVLKDDFQSVLRTLDSLFAQFVLSHVRQHKM